jgi:hypothetical protein
VSMRTGERVSAKGRTSTSTASAHGDRAAEAAATSGADMIAGLPVALRRQRA